MNVHKPHRANLRYMIINALCSLGLHWWSDGQYMPKHCKHCATWHPQAFK